MLLIVTTHPVLGVFVVVRINLRWPSITRFIGTCVNDKSGLLHTIATYTKLLLFNTLITLYLTSNNNCNPIRCSSSSTSKYQTEAKPRSTFPPMKFVVHTSKSSLSLNASKNHVHFDVITKNGSLVETKRKRHSMTSSPYKTLT